MKRAIVVSALVTLCGCGGGGGGATVPPSKTPTSLAISPADSTVVKIGADQTYTASVRWSDGTTTTEAATWQSDTTSVATIDGTGKAHALTSGEATLIARAQNVQGTLKIRVVPDYQGTWTGDYTIRACSESGDFSKIFCVGGDSGFHVGEVLPIALSLTQTNAGLSGTIALGGIVETLDAASSIQIDGGANITAQGTFTDSGITLTITLNPAALRADGPSMHGTFTQIWTVPNAAGSGKIDCELNTVVRSASVTTLETMTMPRLTGLSDVVQLMRQPYR